MARQGDNYYLVVSDTVTEDSGVFVAGAAGQEDGSGGEAKSYGRLTVNQQVASSSDGDSSTVKTVESSTTTSNFKPTTTGGGQPPTFKKVFNDQYAKVGDNLRLDTVILGSPKPKVNFLMSQN